MKKQHKRYKRVATGIVTSAVAVGMIMTPAIASAADGVPMHQHASVQRKAPAWRVGLKAAEAKALGMTVDEFKEARSSMKLEEIIADKGLTFAQFSQNVKNELTATWKADGVSDKDIAARLAKLDKFQDRREHRWEKQQNRK